MRLHTVNKTSSDAVQACVRCIAPGDGVLLLEDGVYEACGAQVEALLATGATLYVLAPDAAARGLLPRLHDAVEQVDYSGFVALAARAESVLSWY